MKIAYFDCFAGIAGDMVLGSLVDAGLSFSELKKELKKLKLPNYDIQAIKSERNTLSGTQVKITCKKDKKERHLKEIFSIIDKSKLTEDIKTKSKDIFTNLARAEAKVHNKPITEVHFHEVGAVDSILDIVGSVIGLKIMGIEKIYSSPLHLGTGFVKCAHGTFPIPAPATLELIKGVPTYSTGVNKELVTPTGAAIITTLSSHFGEIPMMRIEKIGYGIGTRTLEIPNTLRILIGEEIEETEGDRVRLIETNIDNMNPEFYDYVMEELFKNGAYDVYLTSVYMKKNRPGVILSVISPIHKTEELAEIIFKHTTTLGVRISELKRRIKLNREIKKISTKFGDIKVKVRTSYGKEIEILPEYEDCKRIAQNKGVSLKDVYNEAITSFRNQQK